VKVELFYEKLHLHLNLLLKQNHLFDHLLATDRNDSPIQKENFYEKGIVWNVGVVIQDGEI